MSLHEMFKSEDGEDENAASLILLNPAALQTWAMLEILYFPQMYFSTLWCNMFL